MSNRDKVEKFIKKMSLIGNNDFNINLDKLELVKYKGKSKRVSIPVGIETIGNGCFIKNKEIEEVEIPDTVKRIKRSAFMQCTGLKKLKLSESLVLIDDCAFYLCNKLKDLYIPSSVGKIDDSAFVNCMELKQIRFGVKSSLRELGQGAFHGCGLEQLKLPDGLLIIGENAFSNCNKLISVEIPGTVYNTGVGSFQQCGELEHVRLNDGVGLIAKMSFKYCSKLTSIEIPDSVRIIQFGAFSNCYSLESIECKADYDATEIGLEI